MKHKLVIGDYVCLKEPLRGHSIVEVTEFRDPHIIVRPTFAWQFKVEIDELDVDLDERNTKTSQAKEELKQRTAVQPPHIIDFHLLERLNRYSAEFQRPLEELLNTALLKFMDDIEQFRNLSY